MAKSSGAKLGNLGRDAKLDGVQSSLWFQTMSMSSRLNWLIIESNALQQISELAEQYQQITLDILQKALPDGTGRNNLQSWAALMIKRKR